MQLTPLGCRWSLLETTQALGPEIFLYLVQVLVLRLGNIEDRGGEAGVADRGEGGEYRAGAEFPRQGGEGPRDDEDEQPVEAEGSGRGGRLDARR